MTDTTMPALPRTLLDLVRPVVLHFATSPTACDAAVADEPVRCRRCLDRVYRRRDGSVVALGDVDGLCPAPDAARGPHVPDDEPIGPVAADGRGPAAPAV